MTFDALKQNIEQIKEILRECYVFTNQLKSIESIESGSKVVINSKEKKLLKNAITSLKTQLKILNNSTPQLLKTISFYKKLSTEPNQPEVKSSPIKESLIQIGYKPGSNKEKVTVTVSDNDRKTFLENLSMSNLSINQLKRKYSVEKPIRSFGKPSSYAKTANKFFRNTSQKLLNKGYLKNLNQDLRKMNSPFVVGTYVSMMFLTISIAAIFAFILLIILLFCNIGLSFPFFTLTEEGLLIRFLKYFWIVFAIPSLTGVFMYFYPRGEARSIGAKINQELPFVAIHMSAIATSGVQPLNIFKIIVKSEEYKYSRLEFRKLLNLINFQGHDLVTALKKIAKSSPSGKLRELLDGLAISMTSGGNLHDFLDKHAETLLFDYKLEREKYTKTAETFMDIYISIVIAAPMILLMIFVIMGSTGMYFLGLTTGIMSFLIILAIVILNILFLTFLRTKQPAF